MGGVEVSCAVAGQAPTFITLREINDEPSRSPAQPVAIGDVVDVLVNMSTRESVVRVFDMTTHILQYDKGAGGTDFTAFIGNLCTNSPPRFPVISFTHAKFDNSTPLGSENPTKVNMVRGGVVEVKTQPISPKGTAFKTVFVNS
jgi:hypothetical protein